jgi:bifunctional N-acetylglucosamine-1-phosphate-uridyltransferase/glucosamine-1-phosphate-acetyltransferase GlmU-like protein
MVDYKHDGWTAIVPVAGKGSRLDFDGPKFLFPLNGATLLERTAALLASRVRRVILVASPANVLPIARAVAALGTLRGSTVEKVTICIQRHQTGTANAVFCALGHVRTENVLVLWGDQAGLTPLTLDKAIRAHRLVTIPVARVDHPYVHLDVSDSRVKRVLYARELHTLPLRGLQDTGLFLMRRWVLWRGLDRLLLSKVTSRSGEKNFLDMFPLLADDSDIGIDFTQATVNDTVGINSLADVARMVD